MLRHCSRSRWNFTNSTGKFNTKMPNLLFKKYINIRSDGFAVALADFKYRFEGPHVLDNGHRFYKVSFVEKVNIALNIGLQQ